MNTPEPTTDGSAAIVDSIPFSLHLTPSKLPYFYLQVADKTPIDEIQNVFRTKRISFYSLVRTLMAAGLVEQSSITRVHQTGMNKGGEE